MHTSLPVPSDTPTDRSRSDVSPLRKKENKDNCLTCRIRRKKCSGFETSTLACINCLRLNIQCLGISRKCPDWLRNPEAVKETKYRIGHYLIESRFGFRRGRPHLDFLDLIEKYSPRIPCTEDYDAPKLDQLQHIPLGSSSHTTSDESGYPLVAVEDRRSDAHQHESSTPLTRRDSRYDQADNIPSIQAMVHTIVELHQSSSSPMKRAHPSFADSTTIDLPLPKRAKPVSSLELSTQTSFSNEGAFGQHRHNYPELPSGGVDIPEPNFQDSSIHCEQSFKSEGMTSLGMFKCLMEHGCLDLSSSFDPNYFSSYRIAEGGFGDVWKGQLTDGTNVAIKVLRYASVREDGSKSLKRAMREIYNWSKLEHKNIHKLLGVTIFQERLGMVSQWMEHGTLQQYLDQRKNIDRYPLCYQIAEGVAYLHSVNMIHGDLKACNILVSSGGLPKLTDFDFSIISDCSLVFSATTRTGGTLRWMAPELVIDEKPTERNKQTDIYALGMTFLETITDTLPFFECPRDAQIFGKLNRREYPKRLEEYFPANERGDIKWEFLVQCWNYDPSLRPTANQILDTLVRWIPPIGATAIASNR